MDESVHEALSFNEDVEKEQTGKRKTVLNALFAAALAGLWFILSQWGNGMRGGCPLVLRWSAWE